MRNILMIPNYFFPPGPVLMPRFVDPKPRRYVDAADLRRHRNDEPLIPLQKHLKHQYHHHHQDMSKLLSRLQNHRQHTEANGHRHQHLIQSQPSQLPTQAVLLHAAPTNKKKPEEIRRCLEDDHKICVAEVHWLLQGGRGPGNATSSLVIHLAATPVSQGKPELRMAARQAMIRLGPTSEGQEQGVVRDMRDMTP